MKILVADDNHFYRCAMKAILPEWGYEVVFATNGADALEILESEQSPKIAILDWVMPIMDGLEVCRRVRANPKHEPTYIIMLTSQDGKANMIEALDAGADDFVTKPFDRGELKARLQVGRRIVSLQTSETVIYTFARAVDGKSPYTKGHADRVTRYATALAAKIGVNKNDMDLLRRGSLLHDIGKIAVPDAILNKTDKLNPEEFEIMRQHPIQGVHMIEPLESIRDTIPLIRWHHERLDGKGYPDGLSGDQIPMLVRVLSIADVYDAIRSDRPYRAGLPLDECAAILRKDAANGSLDPSLVEEFCSLSSNQLVTIGSGAIHFNQLRRVSPIPFISKHTVPAFTKN